MSIIRGLILMANDHDVNSIHHKIAQCILLNIEHIATLNIEEVAHICYTSPATFSRFCKAMNCTGFNDFKQRLNMSFQDYTYTTLDLPNFHHLNPNELVAAHLENTLTSLSLCKDILNHEQIMSLMRDLHSVETVLFCGWTHLVSLNREFLFDLVIDQKMTHAAFNPLFQLDKIEDFSNTLVFFVQPCKWFGMDAQLKKVKNHGGITAFIANKSGGDLSAYIDHDFSFSSTHSPADYILIEFIFSSFSAYYRKLYTKCK